MYSSLVSEVTCPLGAYRRMSLLNSCFSLHSPATLAASNNLNLGPPAFFLTNAGAAFGGTRPRTRGLLHLLVRTGQMESGMGAVQKAPPFFGPFLCLKEI